MTHKVDMRLTVDASAKAVSTPILVGITGKRSIKLKTLGVSEGFVRVRLGHAFALLDALAPTTEKLLLCGMADGVDEIAARIIIEAIDTQSQDRRFRNWSIIGLLPVPEQAFIDDFEEAGGRWWYHELNPAQRRLVRLMPLQTLVKPSSKGQPVERYEAGELRRSKGQPNLARTAHYDQLGMILAERSTVLIAVMPEADVPDRQGGTAHVVAHRLNGWRPDWPKAASRQIALASSELVVPPVLAASTSGDVWLIPIDDAQSSKVDLCLLKRRSEADPAWPAPLSTRSAEPAAGWWRLLSYAAAAAYGWRTARAAEFLIEDGRPFVEKARAASNLVEAIDAFNCRALSFAPREPPAWDHSITSHPAEPEAWSPTAAVERIRGTLSDIQRRYKKNVQNTIIWLGVLAWFSIAAIEFYAELSHQAGPLWYGQVLPVVYVLLMIAAMWLLGKARRNSWSSVAEDYRVVAEALRVQTVWWQIGLTERRHWVDQHLLRYDTNEFQTLRQGVATLLNATVFRHGPLPTASLKGGTPAPTEDWLGWDRPEETGQIEYHSKTARLRSRKYSWFEFFAWLCFGMSLAFGVWLAMHALPKEWNMNILHRIAASLHGSSPHWLVLLALLSAVAIAIPAGINYLQDSAADIAFRRLLFSGVAGILTTASLIITFEVSELAPELLHKAMILGLLLFLAAAGAIKYVAEKLAIEAEARGSEEAILIFLRARRALNEIEQNLAQKRITSEQAVEQRERVYFDLGHYSLVETETWLRSHRERPLHPAIG